MNLSSCAKPSDNLYITETPIPPPPRSLDEIEETGAGWITEHELSAICKELATYRSMRKGDYDLITRLATQSATIRSLRDENDRLIIDLHNVSCVKEQYACLFLALVASVLYLIYLLVKP